MVRPTIPRHDALNQESTRWQIQYLAKDPTDAPDYFRRVERGCILEASSVTLQITAEEKRLRSGFGREGHPRGGAKTRG